jgi:hypothetical protein
MPRHPWLAVSLAALAVVTLGLKIGLHGAPPGPDGMLAARQQAEQLLAARGWSRGETSQLTLDGTMPAVRYLRADCAEGIIVAAVPPRADAFPLVGELAADGGRALFVYDGIASVRPPSSVTMLRWKVEQVMGAMGWPAADRPAILAIAVPAGCPAARDLPWPAP